MKKFLIILVFLIYGQPIQTQDPNSVSNIFDDNIIVNVMKSYDRDVRPGVKVNLSVTVSLRQLVSIDQVNQIMTTNIYLISNWTDKRLIWDPANYSNLTDILMPLYKIWTPDFIFLNGADGSGFLVYSNSNLAVVNNFGVVNMIVSVTGLKTKCKLNFFYYPFDKQNCSIAIGSWQYDTTRIDFNTQNAIIDLSNYITNPTWSLVTYQVSSLFNNNRFNGNEYMSEDVYFNITLKRGSLYSMINNVFPCLILNAVTLLSYYLPFVSQVNLIMTTFLALAVYSLRVSNDLPVQSEYFSLISVYFFAGLIQTFLSLVWFTISNSWINKLETPRFIDLVVSKLSKKSLSKIEYQGDLNRKKTHVENVVKDMNSFIFKMITLIMIIFNVVIWSIIASN